MNKLTYIYRRFHQMKDAYIGPTSIVRTLWLWLGWINNAILYGATISDYFAYGFYKLQHSGKQEYITYRRYHAIQRKANNKNDIHICRSKIDFNEYFADLLGREWLDTRKATAEDIAAFAQRHPYFFLKEILSYRGIGVTRVESEGLNASAFLDQCLSDNDCHYILEEPLQEISCLQEFHPWSINTIRVVTLYDTTNDCVHIMNARLRMGNKKNNVDNFHFDGIGANIDIETGLIDGVGYDTHNQTYLVHPLTGKQIIGFKMPEWEKCKQFIDKAARRLPSVRYIGWDLVIKPDGEMCLIEANDNADHDFQQLHNKGLWKEYQTILKNM